MQKLFRTHRAALDFDNGFIVAALKSGNDFDLKQEVEIGPFGGTSHIAPPDMNSYIIKYEFL
jgi:hypothetical protein